MTKLDNLVKKLNDAFKVLYRNSIAHGYSLLRYMDGTPIFYGNNKTTYHEVAIKFVACANFIALDSTDCGEALMKFPELKALQSPPASNLKITETAAFKYVMDMTDAQLVRCLTDLYKTPVPTTNQNQKPSLGGSTSVGLFSAIPKIKSTGGASSDSKMADNTL